MHVLLMMLMYIYIYIFAFFALFSLRDYIRITYVSICVSKLVSSMVP